MIKVEKILVPVDFSESSKKAVRYGVVFAREMGAELYFYHVINQRIVDAIHELSVKGYKGEFLEVMSKVISDRENELKVFVPEEWREGLKVNFLIDQGKPGKAIVDKARDLNVDLIIVGCQGHSALGGLLLGSVAQYVVNHGPCPVLVVHPKEKDFAE
ncbi:universal stress protein [Thermodesulforhabdus norvegica]|uniref:Nucleotide-binding universal stress protein, UspA family n=1 Tax=Thermodesulforhabdus norvegica TaxID=39841 RepID=A0A1I4UC52_9BACT|nr:universal stress protein [Thermodesulforhabdus norvegica]SFM86538.1 Nucleotide-binding universal stress protein, UspA family [Thermodesulforhabdus norvegica]